MERIRSALRFPHNVCQRACVETQRLEFDQLFHHLLRNSASPQVAVLQLTKKTKKYLERDCVQYAPRSAHQQHQFVGASTSSSQPSPSTTQSCKAICGTSMMLMRKALYFGASTGSSDQLRFTDNGTRRQDLSDLLHDVPHTLFLRPHLKQRCGGAGRPALPPGRPSKST